MELLQPINPFEYWKSIRYFRPEEFDSPDKPGSGWYLVEPLIQKLDAARAILGRPIVINSGVRTIAHNTAVGGRPMSAHLNGEAVDIKATSPEYRLKLLVALLSAGFTRFELSPVHVHVDVAHDAQHPDNILLVKDTKTGQLV